MSRIDKYLKEFDDYLSGDWDDKEKDEFKKRLDGDQDMQNAWKEYQSILNSISDRDAVSFRIMLNRVYNKQIRNNRIHRLSNNIWFRLSAAAVFILFIGCLLYFFCTNRGQEFTQNDEVADTLIMIPEDSGTIVDYVKNPAAEKVIKEVTSTQIASIYDDERYQIAPAYAELLHNVYRSNWFNLTSPEDSILFSSGDSISFSWDSNIYEPLYFDVLDRKGRVVHRHKDSIESPWVYKPVLEPAIYMYRFSTKDQPVWMGVMVGR